MTALYLQFGGSEFPVEYSSFSIPRYRGASPRLTKISGIDRYQDVKDLVDASKATWTSTRPTLIDIKVQSTDESGIPTSEEGAEVIVKNMIPIRLVKRTKKRWDLYLTDIRQILTVAVNDADFQMKFDENYLEGTEFANIGLALRHIHDQNDLVKAYSPSDLVDNVPSQIFTTDDLALAGKMLPDVVDMLADEANSDLTVTLDGMMKYADRADINDTSKLPEITDYTWSTEPGWASQENTLTLLPETIRQYYQEKHTIRMEGTNGTIADPNIPDELKVIVEQVYLYDDEYLTLDEMLVEAGYQAGDITDQQIAVTFASIFEGTTIERDGTVSNNKLINSIQQFWRRLWRIKFWKNTGNFGGWTDWEFGKLNENGDGTLEPVAVECPYVEFLGVISASKGGQFVGSDATINHDSPAKFQPRWHGGKEGSVIFLQQPDNLSEGSMAVPGVLVDNRGNPANLKVTNQSAIDDGNGNNYPLPGYDVIEVEDYSKAVFRRGFSIYIYVTAVRRLPNTNERWWSVDVDAFDSEVADVAIQELPPPKNIMAYRTYVDASDPTKQPDSDGLGLCLNNAQLNDEDAPRRVDVWKQDYASELEGTGIAESIHAFRDLNIEGPIKAITLEVQGHVIKTTVEVGNLVNIRAKELAANGRTAPVERQERGKAIQAAL